MTKQDAKRLKEARAAIKRLEATLQGGNRFGSYGRSILAAIGRHEQVIESLTSAQSAT
jgi:hypothetical protein